MATIHHHFFQHFYCWKQRMADVLVVVVRMASRRGY
jgi:hypothetical protein